MLIAVGLLLAPAPALSQAPVTPSGLEAVGAAAADLPRLHSLLVSWRGTLVLEHYGPGIRPARPANVKSVSKSIISTLVGVAIARGLIPGVETPLATYFPQLVKDPDPAKRRITIEDLLSMRSGLESTSSRNYGSWVRSPNWVQYVLTRPVVSEPGSVMDYSTGSTHVLSAILTRVTKSSTHAFAQETLGKPLGFTLPRWPRDPQGIYFGGNEMLLTPRQMVSFGELYLNRGRVRSAQVVPAAWVRPSRAVALQSRSALRLRVVDPQLRRARRLLRVGLRRAIHLRVPGSRSGRRHDLHARRERRAAGPPPRDLRHRGRTPHSRDRGAGSRLSRPLTSVPPVASPPVPVRHSHNVSILTR